MRRFGMFIATVSTLGLALVAVAASPELFGLPLLSAHFAEIYRLPLLSVAALSACGLILGIILGRQRRGTELELHSGPRANRMSNPFNK